LQPEHSAVSSLRTYLSLVVAAILWGANFNLVKPILVEMAPLAAGAWRYLIAAAIVLVILDLRGERLSWRHFKAYAVISLFGVVGYNVCFFLALQRTSAVNAALIMALSPLLTVIVAYFVLGTRPRRLQLAAIPVSLVGVAIVVQGARGQGDLVRGDALMLGASLMWAFYTVYVRKLMPADTSNTANISAIMLIGAFGLTALSFGSGTGLPLPTAHAAAALVALAVGGGLIAYYLWNAGVAKVGPGAAALFINLVPVASMLISALLGTPLTGAQLLGGVIVVGAVSLSTLGAPTAGARVVGAAVGGR
jgi:drug/metabolite transporter (DMT)-like permease